MGMDPVSLRSSKQGVPESSRDIMNGHISNMKGNSSAGAAEDSSGLHKASHHHMTESDAAGDKYGLTVESPAQRTLSCLPGQAAENTATWKTMCLLCGNVVYLASKGPQQCQVSRHDGTRRTYATAAGRRGPKDPGAAGNDKNKSAMMQRRRSRA